MNCIITDFPEGEVRRFGKIKCRRRPQLFASMAADKR